MSVDELSRDELIILKQNAIMEDNDTEGRGTFWGELADADELISDKEVKDRYSGYTFTKDDFGI